MLDTHTILKKNSQVISKVIHTPTSNGTGEETSVTETILVLSKQAQVKVINDVGSRIWSLIDGTRTINDICLIILEEYDVKAENVSIDGLIFLEELLEKGLIEIA